MSNKRIKSNYIIKLIFSFVFESNKLKIIKYNKNLQNILNIDKSNYFLWFEKGLTLDKYGNGEITALTFYNIFEGKFKNGKKNGKGKEYNKWSDEPKFEGSYLNDKRHGKGREYEYGFLRFDGKYLNGKRHGKGI